MLDELNISISKNTMGTDYVQIMSKDQISVNVVINANKINIIDQR